MIQVEVSYALPDVQWLITVCLPNGSTVIKAIMASNILDEFPEVSLANNVGIFGKKVGLDRKVKEGDRIEIYRQLILTPNEVRLKRIKKS